MGGNAQASRTSTAALTALGCICMGSAVLFIWRPHLGFSSAAGAAALDTIAGMSAGLAAFLFYGHIRYTRLGRDVILCAALWVLAAANAAFSVVPTLAGHTSAIPPYAKVVTALIGSVLFMAGSWLPPRHKPTRVLPNVAAITIGSLVIGLLAGYLSGTNEVRADSVDAFGFGGGPQTAVLQGIASGCFLLAAAGLVARADAEDDRLLGALAIGAAFAGFSRFGFALAASNSSQWVAPADLFRLAFYGTLAVGAGQEIRRHWRRAAAAAAIEERRRVAFDIHDGLAQELAFIAAQAHGLDGGHDPQRIHLIASAAERALDESRLAIAALTRPVGEPLTTALVRAAEEVADRHDVRLEFDADTNMVADDDTREAFVRIVREAVANAGKHSGAKTVRIELRRHNGIVLRVRDDGSGFDPDHAAKRGHVGLLSMRERAESHGGSLAIHSLNGRGTTVEVWVP